MSSFKRRQPAAATASASASALASARAQAVPLPGTRVSSYNSSVLISSGIASLDDILGGGIPIGSILLLEEDKDTSYAKLVLRYFVAQGLCCPGQRNVLVAHSLDQTPDEILAKLPYSDDASAAAAGGSSAAVASSQTDDEDENVGGAGETMKIAFRYENLKKFETSVGTPTSSLASSGAELPYCSAFDLTKTLELRDEHRSRLHTLDPDGSVAPYSDVLAAVRAALQTKPESTALRIAVQSMASLAWGERSINELFHFLLELRVLLRQPQSGAAAVVTVPGYLIRALKGGPALLRRLEWLCDSVIELESFAGSPTLQAVFPVYSGLIHIHRLPTPKSILPPSAKLSVLRGLAPGSHSTSSGAGGMDNNLGFKLKRRRGLIIETLHLDEGGGTSERRTTPAPSASAGDAKRGKATDESRPVQAESANGTDGTNMDAKLKPGKRKLERRRIRFDDDPSENPSGILAGSRASASKPSAAHSHSHSPGSGLQRDKPELYEF